MAFLPKRRVKGSEAEYPLTDFRRGMRRMMETCSAGGGNRPGSQ